MNAIEHELSKTLREHAVKNVDPVWALMINAANALDGLSAELSIVRADEREACAKVLDELYKANMDVSSTAFALQTAAALIRKRGLPT